MPAPALRRTPDLIWALERRGERGPTVSEMGSAPCGRALVFDLGSPPARPSPQGTRRLRAAGTTALVPDGRRQRRIVQPLLRGHLRRRVGHERSRVMILTGTHDVTKFGKERQESSPRSGRDVHIEEGVLAGVRGHSPGAMSYRITRGGRRRHPRDARRRAIYDGCRKSGEGCEAYPARGLDLSLPLTWPERDSEFM